MDIKSIVLSNLFPDENERTDIANKLENYKYVDDMSDLYYGTYIRWITADGNLAIGAVFCDFNIRDDGVRCNCKNIKTGRYFSFPMESVRAIFQKMTKRDLLIQLYKMTDEANYTK